MAKKKKYVYCWDEVPVVIDVIYASVILGLTAVQVRIMLRRGDLKGVKIGRDWRILKSDIMSFVGAEEEAIGE